MVILTQSEAEELLEMLKSSVEKTVDIPAKGKSEKINVRGKEKEYKNDKFVITINRASKRTNKISFNARYKKGDVVLLRLDVNASPHVNIVDGVRTKICGTHLHIYKEGYDDKIAIPYEVHSPEFDKEFYEFLDKFNVVDKPVAKLQQEIEEI